MGRESYANEDRQTERHTHITRHWSLSVAADAARREKTPPQQALAVRFADANSAYARADPDDRRHPERLPRSRCADRCQTARAGQGGRSRFHRRAEQRGGGRNEAGRDDRRSGRRNPR